MRRLRPCETAANVLEVDYDRLFSSGIRALLFDLDYTLGPRHMPSLPLESDRLLRRLDDRGFRIGILTNRRFASEDPVIRALGQRYPTLHHARKPLSWGYLTILERLGVRPQSAAMLGDRRFTDVFGANRLGIYSILVRGADVPRS